MFLNQILITYPTDDKQYYRVVKIYERKNQVQGVVILQRMKWVKIRTELYPVESPTNDKASRMLSIMKLEDDLDFKAVSLRGAIGRSFYIGSNDTYDKILRYEHIESDEELRHMNGNTYANNSSDHIFKHLINTTKTFLFPQN